MRIGKKPTLVRRGEWGIETGLHGRRDTTLREDAAHLRQGHAPHVLAVLNNTIIGLARNHGFDNLAQARRVMDDIIGTCVYWVRFFGST